jgi:mannose-1-phosphate guanylyltransferase
MLRLFGEKSLLQDTVERVAPLVSPDRTWIITGDDQAAATHDQLPWLDRTHIVGEPCPRDTAPCVGLAAAIVAKRDPEATMLVVPADHVVRPAEAFQRTIRLAVQLVDKEPETLVTLGVRPTRPETGYGYIERGELVGTREGIGISRVKMFREKPDRTLAEQFVADGRFAWNAGVFVWRAATILNELRTHRPDVAAAIDRISAVLGTPAEREVIAQQYAALPRVPIDKAVMEKARQVYVLEVTYDWSDVGDWRSLAELLPRDDAANVVQGLTRLAETRNSFVMTDDHHLLATLGVENLVVVHTGDATLVAHKDHLDRLKALVEGMTEERFARFL